MKFKLTPSFKRIFFIGMGVAAICLWIDRWHHSQSVTFLSVPLKVEEPVHTAADVNHKKVVVEVPNHKHEKAFHLMLMKQAIFECKAHALNISEHIATLSAEEKQTFSHLWEDYKNSNYPSFPILTADFEKNIFLFLEPAHHKDSLRQKIQSFLSRHIFVAGKGHNTKVEKLYKIVLQSDVESLYEELQDVSALNMKNLQVRNWINKAQSLCNLLLWLNNHTEKWSDV